MGQFTVTIGDHFAVRGKPMTCNSRMLESFSPPYTASVVEKLQEAGATISGRMPVGELGLPVENVLNETPSPIVCGDPVRWLARNAEADLIAFEGTAGRVSRFGLLTITPGLCRVGTITKTVEETENLMKIITGHDSRDAVTLDEPFSLVSETVEEKKIGFVGELPGITPQKDIFTTRGLEVVDLSLPNIVHATQIYRILAACEASSSLTKFDGAHENRRATDDEILQAREKYPELKTMSPLDQLYFVSRSEGLGLDIKMTVTLGALALNGEQFETVFLKSAKVRRLIRDDYDRAFEKADFIVSPLCQAAVCASKLVGLPVIAFSGLMIQSPTFTEGNLLNFAKTVRSAFL